MITTKNAIKIARAFVRTKYPLSTEGQKLKEKTTALLKQNEEARLLQLAESELPTVEQPRPHLYAAAKISDEKNFFLNLSNIQVTKGCSHKCSFCAAAAENKVSSMPYPAILKIAEKLHSVRKSLLPEFEQSWQKWRKVVLSNFGYDIDVTDCINNYFIEDEEGYNKISTLYSQQERLHELSKEYRYSPFRFSKSHMARGLKTEILNYYDSDPFDYLDSSFLHQDGSPANYGDVFKLLNTEASQVFITTAGWSRKAKHAILAANSIVKQFQDSEKIWKTDDYMRPRLSISRSNQRARRDLMSYKEDVIENIRTLHKLKPALIIVVGDEPEDKMFLREVVDSVLTFSSSLNPTPIRIEEWDVSHYSGWAEKPGHEDDTDIMSCMPGFHILPDGKIAWQEPEFLGSRRRAKKGSRPQPTGTQLW